MCDFAGVIKTKKEGNMKEINPTKFTLGLLGLITAIAIGGTVSNTLAWYAYATRANLMYSGTSVFDNGSLQIGVKSDVAIPQLVNDGMTEEQKNGSYYYFAPAGEGLTSTYLNTYLEARGYASNELAPVTSGEFKMGDSAYYTSNGGIELKQSPNSEVHCPDYTHNAATNAHFSQITFAFRAFRTAANGSLIYVADQELWLTYAKTRASVNSSGNVSKSMRMYINRDAATYGANNGFIFNPSADEDGKTKVAGLLNLGYDQYYDFDDHGEIIYGEYALKEGYNNDGMINSHYDGEDEIANINGTGDNTPTTFVAKHSPEAPGYYANFNNVDIKTAEYKGINSIKPNKDGNGTLSNPVDPNTNQTVKTSVCVTGDESVGFIGEFDATIYLEGWDFSVIDEEQRHKFDFQLRFEINRVQYL